MMALPPLAAVLLSIQLIVHSNGFLVQPVGRTIHDRGCPARKTETNVITNLNATVSTANEQFSIAATPNGNDSDHLSPADIRSLSSNERFEYRIRQLQLFYQQHGHFCVRERHDRTLAQWVRTQQYEYKLRQRGQASLLTEARVQQLNEIAFEWTTSDGLTQDWMRRYQELVDYSKTHGHVRLGAKDGPLGKWVANQRHQYQRYQQQQRTLMNPARLNLLNAIGMIWDRKVTKTTRHDVSWEERCQELADYFQEHGDFAVPRSAGPLGVWVSNQRIAHARGLRNEPSSLTAERQRKLAELGFEFRLPSHEEVWERKCQELQAFQLEHGHCHVPPGPLRIWLAKQRQAKQKQQLIPARINRLKAIGAFDQTYWDRKWDFRFFFELLPFHEEHGHCCIPDDTSLGRWALRQRHAYHARNETTAGLSRWRENRLRAIGFDFSLEVREQRDSWMAKYQELKEFQKQHGHVRLVARDGPLGKWVAEQRRQYQRYQQEETTRLTKEHVDLLNDMHMIWNVTKVSRRDERWEERLQELEEFQDDHGHCRVPTKSGPLGRWVHAQRKAYAKKQQKEACSLTDDRERKLLALGFEFNIKVDKKC
jgi:hypothetical protein